MKGSRRSSSSGKKPETILAAAVASEWQCSAADLSLTRLAGGCINDAFRVDRPDGRSGFLKWRADGRESFFAAEADGLAALRSSPSLRVPEVWAWDDTGALPWLLLEFVAAGQPSTAYWQALGAGIAELHRTVVPGWDMDVAGWRRDNWIGTLPQSNRRTVDWSGFYVEERLGPQVAAALSHGRLRGPSFWDDVLNAAGEVASQVSEPPSLLHGDLWSGNVYPDGDGQPVVIDPAVYVGHREVDLAMTDLFGGFTPAFHEAYRNHTPVSEAYARVRRPLYQLYPLLVHVNLFGGGYAAQAKTAGERVLAGR